MNAEIIKKKLISIVRYRWNDSNKKQGVREERGREKQKWYHLE
jgi:hypothetical protein